MPAYVICTMAIHDPETYRKFTALTPGTLARPGEQFLTRSDAVRAVEGPAFADRIVLISFPDEAAAMGLHNDADYRSATEFRRLASTGRMLPQVGRDNITDPDPEV